MQNLELVDTVKMDKLLNINFSKTNGKDTTLGYAIVDTEKYIKELYHDYKIIIEQALKEDNYEYLQGLVDGDLQIITRSHHDMLDEDAIKNKCHLESNWDGVIPSPRVVLKQMKYFNSKYGLFIFQGSLDCANFELHPLTKIAMQTLINGDNHPYDVGLNYNEDLYLGSADIETLEKIKDACYNGADDAWVDISQAYPRKGNKCIIKDSLPEDF